MIINYLINVNIYQYLYLIVNKRFKFYWLKINNFHLRWKTLYIWKESVEFRQKVENYKIIVFILKRYSLSQKCRFGGFFDLQGEFPFTNIWFFIKGKNQMFDIFLIDLFNFYVFDLSSLIFWKILKIGKFQF